MEIKLFGKQLFFPFGDLLSYTRILEHYWITKFANIGGNDKVCDVACGNGLWSSRVGRRSAYLTGFDLNVERISQATRKYSQPNIKFIVADAHDFPIKTASQSRVVSYCALEHFPSDIEALREMRRILIKGGTLAMSVDSMSLKCIPDEFLKYHRKRYYIVNYYTLESLKEKLKETGFSLEEFKFLTTSSFASSVLRMTGRYRRLSQFLFPIFFPMTIAADIFFGVDNAGHKMVVKARAIQ